MTEGLLPVKSFGKRLGELARTPEAEKIYDEKQPELEYLVVEGLNELIGEFNKLKIDDPALEIMDGARGLKTLLGEIKLPLIGELPARSVLAGLREGREAMILGQNEPDPEKRKRGILIASTMEASPEALFVGSAAHFLERTYFDVLRKMGINGVDEEGWSKDQIIHPLVDCLMLCYAQNQNGEREKQPILTKMFIETLAEGGIGWKKREKLNKFVEEYKKIR
ncbi:MAG: hypothetical protein WAV41_01960 [Microgenomates group bacterium]